MGGLVRATAGVVLVMAASVALAVAVVGAETPAEGQQASTPASASAPAPARLLVIGQFHGDEVTARSGETWLGLFPTANGFALRATTLKVTTVRDEVLDDEDQKTGKEVAVSDAREPLFLVKAATDLRPRAAVPTVFAGNSALMKDSTIRLASNEGEVQLAVVTNEPAERSAQLQPPGTLAQHSTLMLETRGIVQTLFSMTEHDDAHWELVWAGDLDGDGKLDLLLDLSTHYNSSELRLFLSTAAGKGQAVREVAILERLGC